jgi:hypothetical protein
MTKKFYFDFLKKTQSRSPIRPFHLFLVSFGLCAFIEKNTFAQLYSQQFSTVLSPTSNLLLTSGTYCSPTPNNTQLSSIGSNGAGVSFEVPSGSEKLTFTRTSDVGMFCRGVDFSPIPTAAIYKFDLTVSNNTTAQDNAAILFNGANLLGPSTYTVNPDADIHSRIGINLTPNPGEFSLRNGQNTSSSAMTFTGPQTIFWVVNDGASTISYTAPDGTVQTLAADRDDVWVGTVQAFDEITAVTGARSLRRFKFLFNSGSATLEFDNFMVGPVPSNPVATSPQNFCAISPDPSVANLTAAGSNLKWYSNATANLPLLPSDLLINGTTYYVSHQTVNGFESARTAVLANVTSTAIADNTISPNQTICNNTIPGTTTGSLPTGGNGTYTYQWEASSTSAVAGFGTVAGATGQDFTPGSPITSNRWYRRIVRSGACANTSASVQVTVNPVIANSITAGQNICEGNSAAPLTGAPSGGNGAYTYQWQSSTTGSTGPFSDIIGEINQTYSPGIILQTTWYRRIVSSPPCPDAISNVIQIWVTPTITNNIVTSDQTICTGTAPAAMTGTLPAGGNGTFTYQWEISSTSAIAGFSAIGGAFGQNYTSGTLPSTRWFRRRAISSVCNIPSTALTITVNPLIGNNTLTGIQTICTGSSPSQISGSNPTGGNGTYTYTWESSTTSSTAGFSLISGENGINLLPGVLTQTTWFRRIVSSPPCASITSTAIQVTVHQLITNNTIGSPQIRCSGAAPAAFTASAPTGGSGSYSYLWERSLTDGVSGYSTISGATSSTYTSPALSTTGWFRRIVVSGPCPNNTSAPVEITVHQPIANNLLSPTTQTICTGSTPALIVGTTPTNGNGVYTYSWEVSSTSSTAGFSAIPSETNIDYQPGVLTGTRWYRRIASSGPCANVTSPAVAVFVQNNIANNTISTNQTICTGSTPTALTGTTPTGGGGTGTYTYKWEISTTDGTSGFSPIPTATSLGYAPGAISQNTWFRRIVTSGPCQASTSNTIAITIQQPIDNNIAGTDQTICSGNAPSQLTGSDPTNGSGTYTYQWQEATALAGTYNNISGATGQNLSIGTLTANRWYRRRVTSAPCPVSISNIVAITVVTAIANNTINASQSICSGNIPAAFTGAVPTGGNGPITYQWQISTTSSSTGFSNIPGANAQGYASTALNQHTWFRRVVTAGVCTNNSGVLTITSNVPVTNNTIGSDQTICTGSSAATLVGSTPSGGNGTSFSYGWEFATAAASGPYTNISGATLINYDPITVPTSRWIRRRVSSGVCPISVSNPIRIDLQPVIANNVISSNHSICTGSPVQTLNGNSPTGGNGSTYTFQWQSSITSGSAGFSNVVGETNPTYSPGVISQKTWYRRVVNSGSCTNTSSSVQVIVDLVPTVDAGPAMPSMGQGSVSGALGGSFTNGYSAIWSAPDGSFLNNSGTNPGITQFQSSLIAPPVVPLTLSVDGGGCGIITATKDINIIPDPFGITGVVNQYGEIIEPTNLNTGALTCTLNTGQGARFTAGDRALIIQMKGAGANLPASPTDITYGYLTTLNNAGNYEFLNIGAVNGDIITFERCIKKSYHSWGRIQLVKVPKYDGNYTIKNSSSISAVRLTKKGMGYLPNSEITSGFTITPVNGGTGLQIKALVDNLGQISEVIVLDGGAGYLSPPTITFPDPTEAPFNLFAYKAKCEGVTGLTAQPWNGKTGGILVFEVNGNISMADSIKMGGMGFHGGMIGDKAALSPACGTNTDYALNFTNYTRAGQKGDGIVNIPTTAWRGKGRYGTAGGGGLEPDGGGGGGANWQDGGKGGGSGYTYFPTSACSITLTACENDQARGGLGGGTNPNVPVGFKNVLRSNSYYYQPTTNRIFMGGGGGGGHTFSDVAGSEYGGGGGFGGGIVIIKGTQLSSNGYEIKANGTKGENATGNGAGGGGAGGAILLDIDTYTDNIKARVNGGNGGSSASIPCDISPDGSYTTRYRYFGSGGGGGGGVIWLNVPDIEITNYTTQSNLGQSSQGTNGDGFGNNSAKGGSSRSQSELTFIENTPYLGSVFTVGGTTPKPTFDDLQSAATWLAFRGTDADSVTLLLRENTSSPSIANRYRNPANFTRIFTPGCTFGDAYVILKPLTTPNSVNLVNEIDDMSYITADGLPMLKIKDMKISGLFDFIDSKVTVTNGSKLVLENVDATADFVSTSSGTNPIVTIRSKNKGSFNIGANQTLDIMDSLRIIGDNVYLKSLTLGTGSTLNVPENGKLILEGSSWVNNGASNINIPNSAKLMLTGNFTGQKIGGTTTTNFDELLVSNNGPIAINVNTNVKKWTQTGNSIVNTGTRTLTISDKLTQAGTGRFTGTGGGRVTLNNPSLEVEAEGRFFNLEINSAGHSKAMKDIIIDGTLVLTNGKLNTNGKNITIENASLGGTAQNTSSWVNGPLRRKVAAGASLHFPVGTETKAEMAQISLTAISGGMQYLTTSFKENDPQIHPVFSTVTPFQDGSIYFSSISPAGYWSINPDAGTATYDVALYPSFLGSFTHNSIYKRATGGSEWQILGTLSNPESSLTLIQSDGSVRRTGLVGFSDFGLAGGEEPLPLNFVDFKAFAKRNASLLRWKMAECVSDGRFVVKRGTHTNQMTPVGEVKISAENCVTDFEYKDENIPANSPRFYYQIEASARNEKTIESDIQVVNFASNSAEKPFLAIVTNEYKTYELINEDVETTGIRILAMDGKVVAENIKADGRKLRLDFIPNGVYLVEMVNSGWNVRQKIVVGF